MCIVKALGTMTEGVGSKKVGGRKKPQSKSSKAGLQFPVGRTLRMLRARRIARRVGPGAGVYTAAVLEYLAAEVLELAGNAARDNHNKRIKPRHLVLAVRSDEELNKFSGKTTFASGGVLPHIHSVLIPKKKARRVDGGLSGDV